MKKRLLTLTAALTILTCMTVAHNAPIVYTVTTVEGVHYYAVTGDKSDAETLQFTLDDVDGFIGGVGQHVVVTHHNGFAVINASDEKGRF